MSHSLDFNGKFILNPSYRILLEVRGHQRLVSVFKLQYFQYFWKKLKTKLQWWVRDCWAKETGTRRHAAWRSTEGRGRGRSLVGDLLGDLLCPFNHSCPLCCLYLLLEDVQCPVVFFLGLSGLFCLRPSVMILLTIKFTCRWLTIQNGSGRFIPQVEVDDNWWARPIRRSPVAG